MKQLSPQSLERKVDGLRDSGHCGLYNSNRRFFGYFRTHGEIKGRAQLRFRIETRFFAVPRDDWDDRGPGRDDHTRADNDRGDLFILRGFYGVQGRAVNVTDRLRSMVRDGALAVRVNNENFGGDPANWRD
jgi:hypothetical protein